MTAVVVLVVACWRYLHGGQRAPSDSERVHAVLSFGARGGGLAFAQAAKLRLVEATDWASSTVYLDSDALEGKDGTVATEVTGQDGQLGTAQLNPNWAAYYQAAVEEAPAMVFCLTEAWCRSEWCEQELVW